MIARIQATLTVLTLVVALGLAAAGWSMSHTTLGLALAMVVLIAPAVLFAMQFTLMVIVSKSAGHPPQRLAVLAWAYACELAEFVRVFAWRQPFRAQVLQNSVDGRRGVGVVFIHGYLCNRGLWNPWYRTLDDRGIAFVGVSLEPPFSSIDNFVQAVEQAVATIERATGSPPILLCHSMGGLVARAWLRANAEAGRSDERVACVITIGTPHHGTWLARLAATTNGMQMRQGSAWLADLARSETPARRSKFICLHGACDNIVFPPGVAALQGAEQHLIDATGHLRMAFHPKTFDAFMKAHASAQRRLQPAAAAGAQEN